MKYRELTHPQKRVWYTQESAGRAEMWNCGGLIRIEKELDLNIVEKAFNVLIKQHDSLRLSFTTIEGESRQYCRAYAYETFEQKNLENEEEVLRWAEEDFRKPFQNLEEQLYRIVLLQTREEKTYCYVKYHHIVADGWCCRILMMQLASVYNSIAEERGKIIEEDCPVYEQFMENEKEYLLSKKYKNDEKYWLNKFQNIPEPVLQYKSNQYEAERYVFGLEQKLSEGIRALCEQNRLSFHTFFLSAFTVLVSKMYQRDEFVIGIPVLNRIGKIENSIVGMCASTMPYKGHLDRKLGVKDWIHNVERQLLRDFAHQRYPYDTLAENLLERNSQKNSLYQFSFTYLNFSVQDIKIQNSDIAFIELFSGSQVNELTVKVNDWSEDGSFRVIFDYLNSIFAKEEMQYFALKYQKVLEQLVSCYESQDCCVDQIHLLSKEEETKILVDFQNTTCEFHDKETIISLFEEQVKRTPHKTALRWADKELSYEQFNRRANQLATTLRNQKIGRNNIVAVVMERSVEMMLSIYAIMKAGAAYLPISPNYPEKRIVYMIEDSGAAAVLTLEKELKGDFNCPVLSIKEESCFTGDGENLQVKHEPHDLAYIIYTSGSTGEPKGVMIEQRSLVNRIEWMQKKYKLASEDRILQKTTFTFDVSVWEIFWWGLYGASVCLLGPGMEKEPENIFQTLLEHKITVMHFVPSMFANFLNYVRERAKDTSPLSLRRVFTSGEALQIDQAKLFHQLFTDVKLTNLYGPTEATIDVTYYDCKEQEDRNSIPIGKAIDNTHLYIVGDKNQLQPIGVPGELYIGGTGVGRGYLNRPELTTQRFIQNPFCPEERVYKTGDLVKWLPDGNIEFLGRIDHQVKIRGFRIEIGEIETKLLQHEKVKEAVVVAKKDSMQESYLCAYLILQDDMTMYEIRTYLAAQFPEYMIPSYIMKVNEFPLTSNGKIDRRKLPEPENNLSTGKKYIAPRNKREENLAEIWKELLGVKKIGIADNFFELGGHSLKASLLVSTIYTVLHKEIRLRDVFENPTIMQLANYLEKLEDSSSMEIVPAKKQEYFQLSTQQRQIYLMNEIAQDTSYNMPEAVRLQGDVSVDRMKQALQKLMDRHEMLRMCLVADGEIIKQKICSNVQLSCEYIETEEAHALDDFVRPMDLFCAPLFRVRIAKTGMDCYIVAFDMHHIISDGISLNILISDFMQLYEEKPLDEISIQYQDYVAWQENFMYSDYMKKQEEYWLSQYENDIPVLNLPTDQIRGINRTFCGDRYHFELSQELSESIQSLANSQNATLFMVLLAAYDVLLYKYTGSEDIVVGTPVAGRKFTSLHNLVGMFVNTLAIRNKIKGEDAFAKTLDRIKGNTIHAFENQDYPFEKLTEALGLQSNTGSNPLFDTMFVLQNEDRIQLQIDGVQIETYELEQNTAKFDLTMNILECEKSIICELEYNVDLFKQDTMIRMAEHYQNILQQVCKNEQITLDKIKMLSDWETEKIRNDFNQSNMDFSLDQTIIALFEQQAERTPNHVVVTCDGKELTYEELNGLSNYYAKQLLDKGTKPNEIVGIVTKRSLEMLVGLYAILKSGSAYLPIDPDLPMDRIQYMVQDSHCRILVGGLESEAVIEQCDLPNISIEIDTSLRYENINESKPEQLAYVIYTSGTTGKPKGVMLNQKGLTNLCLWNICQLQLTSESIMLQQFSFIFDGSIPELFPIALVGGRLDIVTDAVKQEPAKLLPMLPGKILEIVPSFFRILLEYARESGEVNYLSQLSRIVLAGEALKPALVEEFYRVTENFQGIVYNFYGPTEACVCSTYYQVENKLYSSLPIGKPIANMKAYIMKKEELCGIGIPGELCIAGCGVAKGYVNLLKITSQKIVKNPFCKEENMFRTGDLASKLPDYMIPSCYVQIDKMPLFSSGKINRKALPKAECNLPTGTAFLAPRNQTEAKVASIWRNLLKIEELGVEDNFFEKGGHSLKASILALQIEKEFNTHMRVKDVFLNPTIAEQAEYIEHSETEVYCEIQRIEEKEYYELSSSQKRLYVMSRLTDDTSYNMPGALLIDGSLDVNQVEKSFQKLIERHEALRTSFELVNGEPVQKVHQKVRFHIEYMEIENREQAEKGFVRNFDLSKAPLLRVRLAKYGENKYMLLFDIHHIVSDGVSMSILIHEFAAIYKGETLSPLQVQYKDYASWQLEQLASTKMKQQENYWKSIYQNSIPVLNLPFDHQRSSVRSFMGDTLQFEIPANITNRLKQLAKEEEATLFMLLISAYGILLHKYSGQDDIVIGTPIAGRGHASVMKVIGMFVNTLALRFHLCAETQYLDYLKTVKEQTVAAYDNQDYPLEELVEALGISHDRSRNPLFDTMFVLQNEDVEPFELDRMKIRKYRMENPVSKFDMTMNCFEEERIIRIELEYCTDLFERTTMERLAEHYIEILHAITTNPVQKLRNINMFTEQEKRQILYTFNHTEAKFEEEKTIPELFLEQVKKTPEDIAVMFGNQKLSYEEFNERACQLAVYLRKAGVVPGTIVSIMVERSLEMLVGIYGIMKAGGAYLPINPEYPEKRVLYHLEDSKSPIVLVTEKVSYIPTHIQVINIADTKIYEEKAEELPIEITSRDLAYIIYTSGSTGNPKGVMIEHRSLVNRLNWMQKKYGLTSQDTILQKTTFTFDVSVWELFWWAIIGAKVYLPKPGVEKEPAKIMNIIREKNITVMHFVPSMFGAFLQYVKEVGLDTDGLKLRQIFTSGEALQVEQVQFFYELFEEVALANLYGPTEATIDVSYYDCSKSMSKESIPIGKPIDNTQFYVAGKEQNLQPIGIPGELWIGGVGLARGYLNKSALTDEKFIQCPFMPRQRVYKTGDLVRLRADGNIEFLGRIDFQVKIRGFRIELGEIENTLLHYSGVVAAVIVVKQDLSHSDNLCAYFVANELLDIHQVRNYMLEQLPEYMVPSLFYQIDEMPLSPNGKVDRKALIAREDIRRNETEYIAPQTKIQKKIAKVWENVLQLERVGIDDSYFEIGGDSIKAIKIVYMLEQQGLHLSIEDLIKCKTIRRLETCVTFTKHNSSQDAFNGRIELSPVQKYFFQRDNLDVMHHFNQSVLLEGTDQFDILSIRKAFAKLANHHDLLRAVCEEDETGIHLNVLPVKNLEEVQVSCYQADNSESIEKYLYDKGTQLQASIDLKQGPLVKLGVFEAKDKHYLLIAMNHLIVDSVSWHILIEDFLGLYQKYQKGVAFELSNKTDSYKIWVDRLTVYAKQELSEVENLYWNQMNQTKLKPIRTDYEISNRFNQSITVRTAICSQETTDVLKALIENGDVTRMDAILLHAISQAIMDWNETDKVMIMTEGNGRNHGFYDVNVNRTIGLFTSIYPVLLEKKSMPVLDKVKEVEEKLRRVPNGGHGYLANRYAYNEEDKAMTEPEVAFNYIGNVEDVSHSDIRLCSHSAGLETGDCVKEKFKLFISSQIYDGRLRYTIRYSIKEYEEDTISELMKSIEEKLDCIATSSQSGNAKVEMESELSFTVLAHTQPAKRKIMLFPPHMIRIAYEVLYRKMSTRMPDYKFYMFHMIEGDYIVNQYADDIIAYGGDEPYLLMGYSAGGNLAFHVALELEKRGKCVSDIILIDVLKWEKKFYVELTKDDLVKGLLDSIQNYGSKVLDITEEELCVTLEKDSLMNEMLFYSAYYTYYINSGLEEERTSANLHLCYGDRPEHNITAIEDTRFDWYQNTKGIYEKKKIAGDHFTLFAPDNIDKNVEVFDTILNEITHRTLV